MVRDSVGNGSTDSSGDPISPTYKETGYGLVGIAGESRSGDANGQYIRVAVGGSNNTVITPPPPGSGLPGPLVGMTMNPAARRRADALRLGEDAVQAQRPV